MSASEHKNKYRRVFHNILISSRSRGVLKEADNPENRRGSRSTDFGEYLPRGWPVIDPYQQCVSPPARPWIPSRWTPRNSIVLRTMTIVMSPYTSTQDRISSSSAELIGNVKKTLLDSHFLQAQSDYLITVSLNTYY